MTQNYRAFVGPENKYDVMSAIQFIRLFQIGLRGDSTLLEIGAGSLRAARLFIPYLKENHYFGLEPERWLVEDGLSKELGKDIFTIKKPHFVYNREFNFSGLSLPSQGVDYCLAQSIFSHTSVQQFQMALSKVTEVLAPKGVFIATYVRGEKDYGGDQWVYPGCVTFRAETVERMAEKSGLIVREMEWLHPNDQTWVLFAKDPAKLNAIAVSDTVLLDEYVNTITELRRRIARVKSFLPIKVLLWMRNKFGS